MPQEHLKTHPRDTCKEKKSGNKHRVKGSSISGLVVEYIVAIDVTWVRFPADAYYWTWGRAIHWHVLAYCCGTEGVNQICETRAIHENPLVVGFRVIDIGVFCKKRVEAPAWRIKLDSNPTGPILRISESPIIYKG